MQLSQKELEILRFIRSSRHKTTVREISNGLGFSEPEVEVFVEGMIGRKLINRAPGLNRSEDAFYTNPEIREKIYELIG